MGYSAIAPRNGRPELNSDPQNTLIFSVRGIAAGTIIAPRGGYPRPEIKGHDHSEREAASRSRAKFSL